MQQISLSWWITTNGEEMQQISLVNHHQWLKEMQQMIVSRRQWVNLPSGVNS